jgi:hypothetical protein
MKASLPFTAALSRSEIFSSVSISSSPRSCIPWPSARPAGQREDHLHGTLQLRQQRLAVGKLDSLEQFSRRLERRVLRIADLPQVFLAVGIDRAGRIEVTVRRGAVGAQVMHRLERVARRVGDRQHAACLAQQLS